MKHTLIRVLGLILSLTLLFWKHSTAQSFRFGNAFQESGYQFTAAITTDPQGNAIRCGIFQGCVDFDPSPARRIINASRGPGDIFIQKSDSLGNLVWVVTLGNNSTLSAEDICSDNSGNLFITGTFQRTVDFNPSAAITNIRSNGSDDVFVLKLNAAGTFQNVISFGGTSNDKPRSIISDASGNIFCSGSFKNTCDFDASSARTFNLTSSGAKDAYLTKLNNNLSFINAVKLGGNGDDQINAVSLDPSGNILCTGYFSNTADLNPGSTVTRFISGGSQDGFILKLNPSFSFVWALQLEGCGVQFPADIVTDLYGNSYVTGYFTGWTDFDPGSSLLMRNSAGQEDIFIQKYNPSGSLLWNKTIGGCDDEAPYSMCLAQGNKPVICGYFDSNIDFDPGASTFMLRHNDEDGFILMLNDAGNFEWAGQIGGNDDDYLKDIAIAKNQFLFGAGNFSETADINPFTDVVNVSTRAEKASYLFKLQLSCEPVHFYESITACNSYFWKGQSYSESGTYNITHSSHGCDTIYNLSLIIQHPDTTTRRYPLCKGSSINIFGREINTAGVYYYANTSYLGCDSILRAEVYEDTTASSNSHITLCYGETISINGIEYAESGTYFQTYSSYGRCDSVFEINIQVLPAYHSNLSAMICEGEQYLWLGSLYAESGDYTHTLTASTGCDSICNLSLSVIRNQIAYKNDFFCDGSEYHLGSFSTTSEGAHTIRLTNTFGCDSTVELYLHKVYPSSSDISVNVCDVYASPSGKYRWVDSGTYFDTIQNIAGCDSFIRIEAVIRRCTTPGDADNRCFPTNLATMNQYSNWMFYPFNNSDNPHIDTTFGTTFGSSSAISEVYGSCDGVLPGRMKTVWFRFKAPSCAIQTLRISTNTISTDFDTRLTVYRQTIPTSCTSGLTEIACNNDVGTAPRPLSSEIILTPGLGYGHFEDGEIYVLQISGYNGDAGNFGLIMEANAPDISVSNIGTSFATIHLPNPDSIPGGIYRGSTLKYALAGSPGYVVQRTIDSLSDSLQLTALLPGTTYNVWNQYSCVDYPWLSKRETFTTLPGCNVGIPTSPQILPSSSSPYRVLASWNTTHLATSYRIFWRMSGSSSFSFANVTDTFYNITLSSAGTNFEFWVEASCNIPSPTMRNLSSITSYTTGSSAKNAASTEESVYTVGNLEFHGMQITDIVKYLYLSQDPGEHEFDLEGKIEYAPNNRRTNEGIEVLELFPNPAVNFTELKYQPAEPEDLFHVKILSLNGSCLAAYKVNPIQGMLRMRVSTQELSSGMYIIKIEGAKSSKSMKLYVTK